MSSKRNRDDARYDEIENQLAQLRCGIGAGAVTLTGTDVIGPGNATVVASLTGVGGVVAEISGTSILQTQGGTLAAPSVETPLQVQPRDPAKARWVSPKIDGSLFNSTWDSVAEWGYNVDQANAAEPTARLSIEEDYEVVPTQHLMEIHLQLSRAGGLSPARAFTCNYDRANGDLSTQIQCQGAGLVSLARTGGANMLALGAATSDYLAFSTTPATGGFIRLTYSASLQTVVQGTDAAQAHQLHYIEVSQGGGTHLNIGDDGRTNGTSGLILRGGNGTGGGAANFVVVSFGGGGRGVMALFTTQGLELFKNEFSTSLLGGGDGVLALNKAATDPTTNPVGGIILYSKNGNSELASRDPTGTRSTLTLQSDTALAAATGNISIAGGTWRNLAAVGGNIAISVDATGAVRGDQITITRSDKNGFTVAIIDTASSATLTTFPSLNQASVDLQFDGSNWLVRRFGTST